MLVFVIFYKKLFYVSAKLHNNIVTLDAFRILNLKYQY